MMDPHEVFDRFNEIIAPNFSLITGHRLNQARINCDSGDDASSDLGYSNQLPDAPSDTAPLSTPGKPSNRSNDSAYEDEKLPVREKIVRNIHGTLFKPKEIAYIERNPESWTKGEDELVLVTDINERRTGDERDGSEVDDDDDKRTLLLKYLRVCYNGHRFGLTKHSMEVGSSSQETVNLSAQDLGMVPTRLLPIAKRHNIQARLISRGKKYRRICERPHILMQYEGLVIPMGQGTDWTWTTDQRVVVDVMAAPKMRGAHVNNSFTASHPGQGLEAFLSTEGYSLPLGDGPSSSQGGDLMRGYSMSDAKGKQKSSEYGKTEEHHEWTDIDYLTCPPTLLAFLLDENIWANIHVEHLTDVVWQVNSFDSLELEIGKKGLLQDLTRRFKTKETSEGSDLSRGGGQRGNLIILLSGPPGVGKTLTTEVVAEETHRPLYRVSARELSFDPSALEKQLGGIFLLARRWGAIILIDDADMFMTKRRASTPAQNAAVNTFVRLFHTYDGLLFLASTSKDIDTAFHDRIHATIEYTELGETQRTNIWRRQLQLAVGAPGGDSSSSRWPEEVYRLLGKVETNGREIRNIVRTAEQLALGLSTEMAMEHVAAAMRNFGGPDNNVGSICEKLEVLEKKAGGHRGQACDDDVELQH